MKHKHAHATGDRSDKSRPDRSMSANLCVDSWMSSVNQSCCPNVRRSARTYRCRRPDGPEGGSVDLFFPLLLPSLSLTPFLSRHLSLFLPPLCPCLHSVLRLSLLPPHFPSPPLFFFSFTLTALHTLFHYDPLIPPFPFSSLCRWLNHEWCKRCVSFFLPDNVCEPKTPQPSTER